LKRFDEFGNPDLPLFVKREGRSLKGGPTIVYVIEAQNYRQALYQALQAILADGQKCSPRGLATWELQDVAIVIRDPRDRVALLPGRKANIFATLAETLWVLAGHDDLEFIGYYLQRISSFSDDGKLLHGAYGPRLKNWQGTNQLAEVLRILKSDPDSRRAVMALFDPARDFSTSRKDIPCNNWMQFSLRDQKLHMRVVSRSMDVIWGSTINVFEWTVIQELLSRELGVIPGTYTHFVGSFHLYEDFLQRAHEVLAHQLDMTCYGSLPWDIPLDSLDEQLGEFMRQEAAMRALIPPEPGRCSSTILQTATQMCWAYALHKHQKYRQAWEVIQQLPACDLTAAALDFFSYNKNYQAFTSSFKTI
jgi:thymidylate synthase